MKLQLTNVGQSPIVVKDQEGYTDFAVTVDPSTTEERDVSRDLVQRLAPHLKALETPVTDVEGNILVALQWGVVASDDVDDRAQDEGLAGLPTLTDLEAQNYSTGGGGSDVICNGTGLLGNQEKAVLSVVEGAAQLDLEAVVPGAPGNDISFELATPAGGATVVAVVANKITVTPLTGGDTVANIRDAINGDANAKLLVQASEGAAGNLTLAQAEKNLAGGKGAGVSLSLGGTACSITALTDTEVTFDIPAGISAASQIAQLAYRNGPHLTQLSVPVVA
jgi:hypothetical protein